MTALKSATTQEEKNAAAVALGSIRSEKKAATSRQNILAAKAAGKQGGREPKPISAFACTCGRGDSLEGHPTTCPRGLVIWRRKKADKL